MAIDVFEISADQREALLTLDESHFVDLKAKEIAPAKLSRTIAAFANASGGELYIGIEETDKTSSVRAWNGFANIEAANGHIQIFEDLFPLGAEFAYSFLECPGSKGYVLQASVQKAADIKRASDGHAYVRRGAQNIRIKGDEALERLKLDKGLTSFETQTIDTPDEIVTNSESIIEFLLNVIPTAEPKPWLLKQLLLRNGLPTVASILLFSDEPQAALPKRCGIKIYRYTTQAEEGTRDTLAFDPETIEGPLYKQIYRAVERTVAILEEIQILGPRGLQPIDYPPEALHEIIANAALHRDYSLPSDIHIRIFDNRVEVESPGRLPGHVTIDNILNEQYARNGILVRLINKFPNPPNKDVGEGLNTAFEAMRKLRLKAPTIEERDNAVLVTIRHERLASPEEAVMHYLAHHDEINNRTARGLTGITSENAMKEVSYRLRDRGLIERVPDRVGSASAWQKKPRNGV